MVFHRLVYPFSAIVGQEKLKLSLILNAINPRIGGVLVTGAKGSGKSSIVRALADLLPEIKVVDGCPFNCSPVDPSNMCDACSSLLHRGDTLPIKKISMRIVQLPLGATEDRVIGAIDTEKALSKGLKALQPGLLADANQNILYIDEVNLLPDHLVHFILDPASSGWNVIQRESISVTHPSRFILVASMNPEEGELRPQLQDRFGLHANAETLYDTNQRTEIILRNSLFEEDPVAFLKEYEPDQEILRKKIRAARNILSQVQTPELVFESVAKVCAELQVDGHRPDIVLIKAAEALAAFNGKTEVKPETVIELSDLALSHRTRKSGMEAPVPPEEIRRALRHAFTELRVTLPPTSDGVKLLELSPKQVKDAMNKFSKFLNKKTSSQKSVINREVTKKRGRVLTALKLLTIPGLILLACYLVSVAVTIFSSMLFGYPVDGIMSLSPSRILPMMGITAAIALAFFLFFPRRKRPSILFFYTPEGGKLSRRVVPYYIPSSAESKSKSEEQLIALRGAYVRRLHRAIVGYGRKITERFSTFSPSKKRFIVPIQRDNKRRRYHLVGKHTKTITTSKQGRYVWYEFPKKRPWDIALAPTIRAAAPHQINRKSKDLLVKIEPGDIRVKVRETRTPHTIVLLIDMSESMTTSLNNVRDAVLNLHKRAYSRRDRIGLIVFKGSEAHLIQPPTTNLNLVVNRLLHVGTSDYTPLAAGMLKAWQLFRVEKYRNKNIIPILVIISDGITNVPLDRPLSPFTRRRFSNPSQADVIDAAHLLAKDEIKTVVINTDHRPEEQWSKFDDDYGTRLGWFTPIDLLLTVSKIVSGRYYGISERGKLQAVVLNEAITTAPTQLSSI